MAAWSWSNLLNCLLQVSDDHWRSSRMSATFKLFQTAANQFVAPVCFQVKRVISVSLGTKFAEQHQLRDSSEHSQWMLHRSCHIEPLCSQGQTADQLMNWLGPQLAWVCKAGLLQSANWQLGSPVGDLSDESVAFVDWPVLPLICTPGTSLQSTD